MSQNKKGLREERLIKRVRHAFKAICAGASVPYGADAAAHRYFYKPASAPTLREAALLAAVLPNPREWSPARPTPYIAERAATIREAMPAMAAPSANGCR